MVQIYGESFFSAFSFPWLIAASVFISWDSELGPYCRVLVSQCPIECLKDEEMGATAVNMSYRLKEY